MSLEGRHLGFLGVSSAEKISGHGVLEAAEALLGTTRQPSIATVNMTVMLQKRSDRVGGGALMNLYAVKHAFGIDSGKPACLLPLSSMI